MAATLDIVQAAADGLAIAIETNAELALLVDDLGDLQEQSPHAERARALIGAAILLIAQHGAHYSRFQNHRVAIVREAVEADPIGRLKSAAWQFLQECYKVNQKLGRWDGLMLEDLSMLDRKTLTDAERVRLARHTRLAITRVRQYHEQYAEAGLRLLQELGV